MEELQTIYAGMCPTTREACLDDCKLDAPCAAYQRAMNPQTQEDWELKWFCEGSR